ncbi:sigma-70 family RNA polymerase sigma factor [Algoriphagus antarcticus]|uniref:RNA polymerase sigma-70 factor (ECF subfamily) n=1 Tax=Algoriphagus antarcticus TaxID=238540 RepID=A0A3E0E1Z3_9BACT|nr:sigma-70 family RNA polymerase sigma factor [Algoriphagus antarcticus]REG90946.1 RNA polymerase sigma-70 factor (ECF subfamily) [Algoriphagus antarcticus]
MSPFQNSSHFEQIFKDNWELMYQSAYSKIGDQSIVEDILQEIFIDIWQRRDSLEIKSGIKTYLFTAVKYQVMKHFDELAKSRANSSNTLPESTYEEDVFGLEELYKEIEVAVEMLPPRSQLVFRMSRLEGYSTDEIAEKLKISPQTVNNQLTKSLKIMRSELKHLAPALIICLMS